MYACCWNKRGLSGEGNTHKMISQRKGNIARIAYPKRESRERVLLFVSCDIFRNAIQCCYARCEH